MNILKKVNKKKLKNQPKKKKPQKQNGNKGEIMNVMCAYSRFRSLFQFKKLTKSIKSQPETRRHQKQAKETAKQK